MEFEKVKIKSGPTILLEKRKQPIVSVLPAVRFGSAYETSRFKGIAHAIEHMAFKGTKKRTPHQIASTIEKVGGELNAYTDEELTHFYIKLPSKHFAGGFDVLADIMTSPLFDLKEFEKEKHVLLEEIKMYHDSPRFYATEKIKELLYARPFGLPIAGTETSVKAIKREDLLVWHSKNYGPVNMIVAVVGNTDIDAIKGAVKVGFPPKAARPTVYPSVRLRSAQEVEKRKGLDQTHLVLGWHTPTMLDKRRYAIEVFNTILGEGMSSRLFQEIREKRGLAYAAQSSIDQFVRYGYTVAYIGTDKEKVKLVKGLVLKEIKKMQLLSSKELGEAKEKLIGKHLVESESSERVAFELIQNELAGQAEEYYRYVNRIAAVKLADVRALGKLRSYSFFALVPD